MGGRPPGYSSEEQDLWGSISASPTHPCGSQIESCYVCIPWHIHPKVLHKSSFESTGCYSFTVLDVSVTITGLEKLHWKLQLGAAVCDADTLSETIDTVGWNCLWENYKYECKWNCAVRNVSENFESNWEKNDSSVVSFLSTLVLINK